MNLAGSSCGVCPAGGVAVLVRVQGPNNSAAGGATGNWGWSIKAALDSGADGVIVPQVRTADEVRSVVADCRYPTGPKRAAPFDTQMTGPSSAIAYPKRGMGHMIASNYFREEFYHYLEEVRSPETNLNTLKEASSSFRTLIFTQTGRSDNREILMMFLRQTG